MNLSASRELRGVRRLAFCRPKARLLRPIGKRWKSTQFDATGFAGKRSLLGRNNFGVSRSQARGALRVRRPRSWPPGRRPADGQQICHINGKRAILRLMDQLSDLPPQPAEYYRRKAARARQVAEGVTTRAIKARLLELAVEYDRLADGTESATRQSPGLSDQ